MGIKTRHSLAGRAIGAAAAQAARRATRSVALRSIFEEVRGMFGRIVVVSMDEWKKSSWAVVCGIFALESQGWGLKEDCLDLVLYFS